MSLLSALSAHGAIDLRSVRFRDAAREAAFRKYSVKRDGPTDQFVMISGAGIHLAYGALDAMTLGPLATWTIMLRAVGFLAILALAGWTFTPTGRKYMMWVSAAITLIIGGTVAIMLEAIGSLTPPYYIGMIHLAVVISAMVRLNFRVTASLLIALYVMILGTFPDLPVNADVISAHFFLVASFVSCATISFVVERNRRLQFIDWREKEIFYAQVQELANAAEDSLRRRNALLNVLGHVVKTPLHQIIGYAQVIEQTTKMHPDQAETGSFAEEISRAGQNLAHQSQRILEYTRADAGLLATDCQHTTLKRIVSEAAYSHIAVATEKCIDLSIECDDIDVFVDTRHIIRGVEELVDNAVRYSPPGSQIWITSEYGVNGPVLSILDNGPGVPEGDIDRIRDALNNTENFRNVGGDKLGIGVSLARIMLRLGGGMLYFSSLPDRGTLAQVTFAPAKAQADATALKQAS